MLEDTNETWDDLDDEPLAADAAVAAVAEEDVADAAEGDDGGGDEDEPVADGSDDTEPAKRRIAKAASYDERDMLRAMYAFRVFPSISAMARYTGISPQRIYGMKARDAETPGRDWDEAKHSTAAITSAFQWGLDQERATQTAHYQIGQDIAQMAMEALKIVPLFFRAENDMQLDKGALVQVTHLYTADGKKQKVGGLQPSSVTQAMNALKLGTDLQRSAADAMSAAQQDQERLKGAMVELAHQIFDALGVDEEKAASTLMTIFTEGADGDPAGMLEGEVVDEDEEPPAEAGPGGDGETAPRKVVDALDEDAMDDYLLDDDEEDGE